MLIFATLGYTLLGVMICIFFTMVGLALDAFFGEYTGGERVRGKKSFKKAFMERLLGYDFGELFMGCLVGMFSVALFSGIGFFVSLLASAI